MRRCRDIVAYVIPMLCFVAVLVIEYKGAEKRAREYRELEHFAEFLSDLKDCFSFCKNVTESIFRAAERVPGSLRKRLEEICSILESDAMEVVVSEEKFPGHLKYVRLFMIQCRSAVQYGSGKKGTESVFVKNMTELRRDVQNECYQRKQAMYLFAGLGVIASAPMVFLPVIRRFGSTMMEELRAFYEGSLGDAVVAMFFCITGCCYVLLWMLRQTSANFAKSKIGSNAVSGPVAVMLVLIVLPLLRGTSFFQKTIAVLVCVAAALVIVRLFRRYLAYLRNLGKGSEILGLQAMVLLLLDVPNLTLMELLDVLGNSAVLFRSSILRCAEEYAADDIAAIERMQAKEKEPAFRQFIGRIVGSEQIGLKAAFSEIASDRQYFREQLRLDMEQEQKKRAANAQVVAFIPMLFLLFAYLILPFLAVSLGQMRDIFREMEQIRFLSRSL